MNLQLTKKMQDKLKVELSTINTEEYNDIDNFHCNLLSFGRLNCVLITNDKTFFSFVLFGFKAKEFKDFEYIIREYIFKTLLDFEFSQKEIEKVLYSLENITYSKTSNKSVLSTMTDIKFMIGACLEEGDNYYEINKRINKIPYSKIKYSYAIKEFTKLLKEDNI